MRISGLLLFFASLFFGLGAENMMGSNWLTENALTLMFVGMALGLAWAVFDFWPRAFHMVLRYRWLTMDEAGRLYRDLLEARGQREGVRMFDAMVASSANQEHNEPVASAFRWILQEGINDGQIEAWGTPENGLKSARIFKADDNHQAYVKSRRGDSLFLMSNGTYYRDITVRRSSLKSYVTFVMRHDDELKRRSQKQN